MILEEKTRIFIDQYLAHKASEQIPNMLKDTERTQFIVFYEYLQQELTQYYQYPIADYSVERIPSDSSLIYIVRELYLFLVYLDMKYQKDERYTSQVLHEVFTIGFKSRNAFILREALFVLAESLTDEQRSQEEQAKAFYDIKEILKKFNYKDELIEIKVTLARVALWMKDYLKANNELDQKQQKEKNLRSRGKRYSQYLLKAEQFPIGYAFDLAGLGIMFATQFESPEALNKKLKIIFY